MSYVHVIQEQKLQKCHSCASHAKQDMLLHLHSYEQQRHNNICLPESPTSMSYLHFLIQRGAFSQEWPHHLFSDWEVLW